MKYLGGLGNDDAFEAVSSYDNLKVWWNTAVSSDIPAFPTGKKWLDLLEDDDWREAMVLFVSTGIGHKSWTLSLASKMQKHDFADVSNSRRSSMYGTSTANDFTDMARVD